MTSEVEGDKLCLYRGQLQIINNQALIIDYFVLVNRIKIIFIKHTDLVCTVFSFALRSTPPAVTRTVKFLKKLPEGSVKHEAALTTLFVETRVPPQTSSCDG